MANWEDMASFINPKRLFVGCFVPNWVRERTELTMTAKVVYATLVQHASEDGVAWPSQATLAKELGCTDRCVRSAVGVLETYKMVLVDRDSATGSNKYRFYWHPWMGIPEKSSTPPEKSSAGKEESSNNKITLKESKKKGFVLVLEKLNLLGKDSLMDAASLYERHRKENGWSQIKDTTADQKAREWSEFSAVEIEAALRTAVSQGWRGVFPKKSEEVDNGGYEKV